MPASFTLSEAFAAIQRIGLLGEYDGGTWLRHVAREFGPDEIHHPLEAAEVLELLYLARAERRELQHTQGHASRVDGLFLARDLRADDPAEVRASVEALAAHFGVRDVAIDDPTDVRSIFTALGRAFAAAGAKERAFLVGRDRPFIVIRERLEPIGPFDPITAFGDTAIVDEGCPICGWTIDEREAFCPACRVGITVQPDGRRVARAPELGRGEAIEAWDFRAVPPPGCRSRELEWPGSPADRLVPHADGVVHELHAAQTITLIEPGLRLRRGAVRVGFTALTPGCRVGVAVRDEPIGAASIRYVLDLAYSTGVLFVARLVVGPELSSQTALVSADVWTRLRPMGERQELELRVDGGWLMGYVNGALALRAYDPAYGIGGVGLRVGREASATEPVTRVLLHDAAVHWLEGAR